MKKFLLSLVVFLVSHVAFAGYTLAPVDCKFFSAIAAGSDTDSSTIELRRYKTASFQVTWSSVTGTSNGVFTVQASNDGSTWVSTGVTATMSGASGSALLKLDGAVDASFYRVDYAHTGVTGGSITGYCTAKEF